MHFEGGQRVIHVFLQVRILRRRRLISKHLGRLLVIHDRHIHEFTIEFGTCQRVHAIDVSCGIGCQSFGLRNVLVAHQIRQVLERVRVIAYEPSSSTSRTRRAKLRKGYFQCLDANKGLPNAVKSHMRIVTYNIHKARGMDGRTSIKRIANVLGTLDADIIALQEIFSVCEEHEGQVEALAAELGLKPAFGCTRHHRGRPYGNAILTRWPILKSHPMDISWGRRENRGYIRADLKTPRGMLHVFNIHMGTRYFERRHQVRNLLASKPVHEDISGPRVLVGDFNEWTKGLTTRMLSEKFESLNLELHVRKRRSYPGLLPLLHLDHIYFERPLHVEKAELIRTRLSKIASDHLPLIATFAWEGM